MFRFVHAWQPGDPTDDRLTTDGFVGVECDDSAAISLPDAVSCVGWRGTGKPAGPDGYRVRPAIAVGSPSAAGIRLNADAEASPGRLIVFENGGAFRTAWDLWTVLEAARHPRVKLALDVDAAKAAGQTAAVLVPTLNLRIGLLRVHTASDELTAYARRLAGIGFDGYVVLDPPAGEDRIAASTALAAVFRSVIVVKLVKKTAAPKAVVPKTVVGA